MRYLKKFNESLTADELDLINQRVRELLRAPVKNGVRINPDGTVDVEGNASLEYTKIEKLDIKFGSVGGSIWFTSSRLTSLEGFPKYVGGDFNIRESIRLTSLEGGPDIVEGHVNLFGCTSLTSLDGGPHFVRGTYFCGTTPKLSNLIGCPVTMGEGIQCTDSGITSLEGLPERHDSNLILYNNKKLTTMRGIPKFVGGNIDFRACVNLWDASPLKDCDFQGDIDLFNTPLSALLYVFDENLEWFKDSLDYNYIREPIAGVDGMMHPTIDLFRFKEALNEFDIDYWEWAKDDDWNLGPKCPYHYGIQQKNILGRWLFVDDRGRRVNFYGEVLE